MSAYRGRPNVNVTQFLANLNTIPAADEQVVDTFNPDDLALFTNTQFFDFDMGEPVGDFTSSSVSFSGDAATGAAKDEPLSKRHIEENDIIDSFLGGYDYGYPSILQTGLPDQQLPPASATASPSVPLAAHSAFPHDPSFSATGNISTPATVGTSQPSTPSTPNFSSGAMNITSPTAKRKSLHMESTAESLEEASRLAAEEDKRRRNTAASARFRIKKKQREQALEKNAKELGEKVAQLELKINQLEMENKWLKNLITEKNTAKKDGTTDISELFNAKFSAAASAPAAGVTTSNSSSLSASVSSPQTQTKAEALKP